MIICGDQRLGSVPEQGKYPPEQGTYPWRFLTEKDSCKIPRVFAAYEDGDELVDVTGYLCHKCYGQVRPEDAFVDHPVRCVTCRDCGLVWRRGHEDPNGENVYGDDE